MDLALSYLPVENIRDSGRMTKGTEGAYANTAMVKSIGGNGKTTINMGKVFSTGMVEWRKESGGMGNVTERSSFPMIFVQQRKN